MPESTNTNYGQAPPESIQKTSSMPVPFLESPNSRNGAESSQKASLMPAPLLETTNHEQDHDWKIEAWNEKKQDIVTKYTVSKWTHAQSVQQFLNVMTWCARRPAGGVMDVSDVPWPVLKKPESISPKDVNDTEIEYFLEKLKASTKSEFPVHLKEMRIRFHPDKWGTCWERIMYVEEQKKWQKAMLMLSQIISSYYDMYMRSRGR